MCSCAPPGASIDHHPALVKLLACLLASLVCYTPLAPIRSRSLLKPGSQLFRHQSAPRCRGRPATRDGRRQRHWDGRAGVGVSQECDALLCGMSGVGKSTLLHNTTVSRLAHCWRRPKHGGASKLRPDPAIIPFLKQKILLKLPGPLAGPSTFASKINLILRNLTRRSQTIRVVLGPRRLDGLEARRTLVL